MPDLYQTFIEAFSDYALDMSQLTEQSLYNRGLKNGIDFESSVGVYANGKMIGFTMIGLDRWKNALAAFDVGTGIIKSHRGRGIAQEMFRVAVPELRAQGVKKFVLEVLQENEPAIKAYQKTGFRITRELDCFKLDLAKTRFKKDTTLPIEIRAIRQDQLSPFEPFLDWHPSWENSFASIKRIPDRVFLFAAVHQDRDAGLIAYYPALNWIMSIAVKHSYRRQGVGTSLLKHLVQQLDHKPASVKLLNVEHTDRSMIRFLNEVGFELYTRQFEMEFDI